MTTAAHSLDAPALELARDLLAGVDDLTDELFNRIISDDDFYLETTLIPREELYHACLSNLTMILGQLCGDSTQPDAAAETGRMKAEYGVPLSAFRWSGCSATSRKATQP